ncbi:MAG TPA: hypothetical protein PKA63_13120 [Oligoflexia bacterium]|nr:hypothetical protein [Oligoflexia bacterium]HMP49601.1 hypothetical protein [Oligoflexia bacterium]
MSIQQQNIETERSTLSSTTAVGMGVTARGIASGNSLLVAQGILTGAYKAIEHLTKEQKNFLSKLEREPELKSGLYTSMAHVISMTALGAFSQFFTLGDTPAAKEILLAAREKVNAATS